MAELWHLHKKILPSHVAKFSFQKDTYVCHNVKKDTFFCIDTKRDEGICTVAFAQKLKNSSGVMGNLYKLYTYIYIYIYIYIYKYK